MVTIKKLRTDKNITQYQLAKELGVSQTSIIGWEKDIYTLNSGNLKKVAIYFNVSADDLLDIKLK